jgi:hypothetical protein
MLRAHVQSALQNLVLVLPLVLGGGFLQPGLWSRIALGYGLFTALSVLHAEALRRRDSIGFAPVAFVLYALLLGASARLHPSFGMMAAAYTALALFNGLYGHRIVVLDVLSIAGSVVLKAMAGVLLIQGQASSWALLFLFLGACTVALGQRRNELRYEGTALRLVLHEYSPKLLDQMLAVVTSSTLVAYSLYGLAQSGQTVGNLQAGSRTAGNWMVYSTLLVDFGLFRYLYLVYHHDMRCGAELAVTRDPQLVGAVAAWLVFATVLHYVS